jgi:hypothetical protein
MRYLKVLFPSLNAIILAGHVSYLIEGIVYHVKPMCLLKFRFISSKRDASVFAQMVSLET